MTTGDLAHEHADGALVRVQPRGRRFSMLVTPASPHDHAGPEDEPPFADFLAAVLRRTRLFVDVGARCGYFSLLAATEAPHLRTIAFEPAPETFAVLQRNLEGVGTGRVELHQAAVASAVDAPFSTRIDDLLRAEEPSPTLVKIDAEAQELSVLRGMTATLARFRDLALLIVRSPRARDAAGSSIEELVRELDRLGFATFLLDESTRLPFRVPSESSHALLARDGRASLYCVRKERALSVCFFSHGAFLNGAERELLDLTTGLVAEHGAVCSVVLPGGGPLATALRAAGVGVLEASYPWWCVPPPGTPGPVAWDELRERAPAVLEPMLGTLVSLDPDVVATQTLTIPWGALAAALLGKPHVWSVCEFGRKDHDLRFFLPFETVLEEIDASSAFVFTCSDVLRRELFPSLPAARCRPLYQHIAVSPAQSSVKRFSRPGAVRLGLFATLWRGKGQEDAVRAAKRLVRAGHDVELLLAGPAETEYRNTVEALVAELGLEERVRIAGFIDEPFAAMQEADILLQCSRSEAFGRGAVEAMLLGKPLVYAAAGGFLEYLEDGRTGLAYPPGDDAALAAQIGRLIASPEERARLGSAARESALSRFDGDRFFGEFFRVAARLVTTSPARVGPALREVLKRVRGALVARAAERDVVVREQEERLRAAHDQAAREVSSARKELEAAQLDLARARSDLEAITGSASWRLTKPFRKWRRSYLKRRDALRRRDR